MIAQGVTPPAAADAGPLLRYRRTLRAEGVAVLADVKKKHSSHALTSDVDLASTCRAAEFFGVDGIVVTGGATGEPTDPGHLAEARAATGLPLVCGSGTTPDNVGAVFAHADAAIVGSWFKQDGLWSNPPDRDRARALVEAARGS